MNNALKESLLIDVQSKLSQSNQQFIDFYELDALILYLEEQGVSQSDRNYQQLLNYQTGDEIIQELSTNLYFNVNDNIQQNDGCIKTESYKYIDELAKMKKFIDAHPHSNFAYQLNRRNKIQVLTNTTVKNILAYFKIKLS